MNLSNDRLAEGKDSTLPNRFHSLVGEVFEEWIDVKARLEIGNRTLGLGYNPLEIIGIKEVQHSKLLGDLLDPNGRHGQGDLFLNTFLRMLRVPDRRSGNWKLTVEHGRVDIMIWREEPRSALLIENKACGAVDQRSQLYRYWYEQVHRWNPELEYPGRHVKQAFQVIYLVPSRGKIPVAHSLKKPHDLQDEDAPDCLPIEPKVMTLLDLTGRWIRDCRPAIPPTNLHLLNLLDCYHELWKP